MIYLPLIVGVWTVLGACILIPLSDHVTLTRWSYAQNGFVCLLCGPLGWLAIIVWCIVWCLSRFWKFLGSFGKN